MVDSAICEAGGWTKIGQEDECKGVQVGSHKAIDFARTAIERDTKFEVVASYN